MSDISTSFVDRLKKIFSSQSTIVNLGGNKIKVVDINHKQLSNIPNNFQFYDYERYGRLYSTLPVSLYNSTAAFNYQLAKIELYKAYEDMDRDSILASILDVYADECLGSQTVIPLLDGRKLTIKELYDNNEKDFWVYSLDMELNKFLPNKCQYVKYNGKKKMYRLTLDDGTEIEASENHIWVTPMGKNLPNILTYTTDLSVGNTILSDREFGHKIINITDIGEQDAYDLVNVGDSHIYAIETKDGSKLFCHNCSQRNEYGDIIRIKTSNENVQEVLQNLYYDVMNIEFNLWSWVRGLVKYGDMFLKINVVDKYGVVNVQPLSTYSMVRVEDITNPKSPIKFVYDPTFGIDNSMLGRKIQNFEEYEIAHFRLISDSNFLPYGRSILEPARKAWEQLCLSGDSEVWTPTGYTEIKDLKPGDDIYCYDYKENKYIPTKVKHHALTGRKTLYEIRTSHRLIKATDYHPIMLVDGTYKQVKDLTVNDDILISDFENNSIEEKDIKYPDLILPDLLYANFNDDVFEQIYDICELDGTKHKNSMCEYLHINYNMNYTEYVEKYKINKYQQKLIVNNSRIPYKDAIEICNKYKVDINQLKLYIRESNIEAVYEKDLKDNFKMFVRFFGFMLGDGWLDKFSVCFSIGDRRDKSQKYIDFSKIICKSGKEGVKKKKSHNTFNINSLYFRNLMISLDFRTGTKNKIVPSWIYELPNEYQTEFLLGFADADGCKVGDDRWQIGGINKLLLTQLHHIAQRTGLSVSNITFNTPTKAYEGWGERKSPISTMYAFCFGFSKTHFTKIFNNKKVEKIKLITELNNEEVYDIEVDNDLHNFIVNGITTSNCLLEDAMLINRIMRAPAKRVFKIDVGGIPPQEIDSHMNNILNKIKKVPYMDPDTGNYNLKFNMQNLLEDFYVPTRGGQSGTAIEELGGITFDGIEDINYIKNRMLAALKVPKSFIGYDDELGSKGSVAALDLRFARSTERVQRFIESELYKIGMIHLYVQGFSQKDMADFKLSLTPSSKIYEKEQLELWKAKMEVAGEMLDKDLLDSDFIYENVMDMSDEQAKEMKSKLITDAKFKFRLEQIKTTGQDPKMLALKAKKDAQDGKGTNNWELDKDSKEKEEEGKRDYKFEEDKDYIDRNKEKEPSTKSPAAEPFDDIYGKKDDGKRYKRDTELRVNHHKVSPLSIESKINQVNRMVNKLDEKYFKKDKKDIIETKKKTK
jgi:hypothetical protein